jgi:hypothetical protein
MGSIRIGSVWCVRPLHISSRHVSYIFAALVVSMSFRGVGVVGGKADPVETDTKEESEAGGSSTIGNQSGEPAIETKT